MQFHYRVLTGIAVMVAGMTGAFLSAENPPPSTSQPVSTTSQPTTAKLLETRKAYLEMAAAEETPQKQAHWQIEAAKVLLKMNDKKGLTELEQIVNKNGTVDGGNVGGEALIAVAEYWIKQENWQKAEEACMRVQSKYKGSYGDKGCAAMDLLVQHYADKPDIVAKYKLKVIECGGSYHGPAGDACLWLADYYVGRKENAKAIIYLKQATTDYKGPNNRCAKAAKDKLKELGEPVD